MIPVHLPAPRDGAWLGVMIEPHAVAGAAMIAVTIRPRAGQPIERKWFTYDAAALAWALDQADSRHLPLFDLRDNEAE